MVLWVHASPPPNGISISSSVSAALTGVPMQHTDTRPDHVTCDIAYVAIGRNYRMHAMTNHNRISFAQLHLFVCNCTKNCLIKATGRHAQHKLEKRIGRHEAVINEVA